MTPAEKYRRLAATFRAQSRAVGSKKLAAEWDHLANCYDRLAEQAAQNETFDEVHGRVPQAPEPSAGEG